jgi:hypothetical protein
VLENLHWLGREHADPLETLREGRLAAKVAGGDLGLPSALGEQLLVFEQVLFVDRDAAFASLRDTARLDDSAGLVLDAGAVTRSDFDVLLARLGLLAPGREA